MYKEVTKISNITQHDSDIVTPYGKWAYYNATIRFTLHYITLHYITRTGIYLKFKRRQEQQEDKSEGKTKDALMKVPHQSCKAYS